MTGPPAAGLPAVFRALQGEVQTWIVGGFLRERYFQRLPLDVDLVVPDGALELARKLRRQLKGSLIPLDPEREIFRLVTPDGISVDIARYAGATLEEDLRARDLTINAMACPVTEALLDLAVPFAQLPLVDPCRGAADLAQQRIRGNSRANFASDPLRLLRAFRFAGALGFALDAQTAGWIRALAPRLAEPAAERVLKELELICRLPQAAPILAQLFDFGILETLIPELPPAAVPGAIQVVAQLEGLLADKQEWEPALQAALQQYGNEALAGARPRCVALKLAALLMALPSPPESVEAIGRRLSLSIREIELIGALRRHTGPFLVWEGGDPRQRYRLYQLAGSHLPGFILLALAGRAGEKRAVMAELLQGYLDPANRLAHPPRLVSGREVMQALGLKPGPLVGEILAWLQEEAAIGAIATPAEAVARASVLLADNRQQLVP